MALILLLAFGFLTCLIWIEVSNRIQAHWEEQRLDKLADQILAMDKQVDRELACIDCANPACATCKGCKDRVCKDCLVFHNSINTVDMGEEWHCQVCDWSAPVTPSWIPSISEHRLLHVIQTMEPDIEKQEAVSLAQELATKHVKK